MMVLADPKKRNNFCIAIIYDFNGRPWLSEKHLSAAEERFDIESVGWNLGDNGLC